MKGNSPNSSAVIGRSIILCAAFGTISECGLLVVWIASTGDRRKESERRPDKSSLIWRRVLVMAYDRDNNL
jgi:hypothetical protein